MVAGLTEASSENSYGSGDGDRGSGVVRWECARGGEMGSRPLVPAMGCVISGSGSNRLFFNGKCTLQTTIAVLLSGFV